MKPFLKKSLATLGLMALALTTTPTPLPAAENPFQQAAATAYTGLFIGKDATLRLTNDASQWAGNIIFKGTAYAIQGEQKEGKLLGTFSDSNGSWPFTAQTDGNNLVFTAGTFSSALTRQKPPRLKGIYQSSRVKLVFNNKDAGYNGTIEFQGKEFDFSAKETAGILDGIFKSGDETFPFTLRVDADALFFKSSSFEELISLGDRRSRVAKLTLEIQQVRTNASYAVSKINGRKQYFPTTATIYKLDHDGKLCIKNQMFKDSNTDLGEVFCIVDPQDILWEKNEQTQNGIFLHFSRPVKWTADAKAQKEIKDRLGELYPEAAEDFPTYEKEESNLQTIQKIVTEAAVKLTLLQKQLAAAQDELP